MSTLITIVDLACAKFNINCLFDSSEKRKEKEDKDSQRKSTTRGTTSRAQAKKCVPATSLIYNNTLFSFSIEASPSQSWWSKQSS